jgi:receptor expression-enhancing protein 5/6
MDILNQKLKSLSPLANKIPQVEEFAKQFGVESGVLLGAGLLLGTLVTFILFGGTILTLTITVLYPAFKSILALETESTTDDKEWLTYWIIFGIFNLIDEVFGCFLSLIPYWYWAKLLFFIYLLAPQTRGAQFLYSSIVKDLLERNKWKIEGLINDVKYSVKDVASEAKRTAAQELSRPERFAQAASVISQAQAEVNKIE